MTEELRIGYVCFNVCVKCADARNLTKKNFVYQVIKHQVGEVLMDKKTKH